MGSAPYRSAFVINSLATSCMSSIFEFNPQACNWRTIVRRAAPTDSACQAQVIATPCLRYTRACRRETRLSDQWWMPHPRKSLPNRPNTSQAAQRLESELRVAIGLDEHQVDRPFLPARPAASGHHFRRTRPTSEVPPSQQGQRAHQPHRRSQSRSLPSPTVRGVVEVNRCRRNSWTSAFGGRQPFARSAASFCSQMSCSEVCGRRDTS